MSKKSHRKNSPESDIHHRIKLLKEQVQQVCGDSTHHISEDCPPEIEEQFWKNVLAYEQAAEVSLFDEIVKIGVPLPPPEELDEAQLKEKLWQVIQALSLLGAYIERTDHLSDRELYTELWNEALREPTVLMPAVPEHAWHIDLIGSGSEEDIKIYLKYYAHQKDRRYWARHWPELEMPDREKPPFDRDRFLPKHQVAPTI